MIAAAAPTFAVQLASAAEPGELEAWLACSPKSQAVYASGLELPRNAPGVLLVTRWREQGIVITTQRRDPRDARRWEFIVVRRAENASAPTHPHGAPPPGSHPSAVPPAPAGIATPRPGQADRSRADHTRAQLKRLEDLLRARAAKGAACPTLAETRDLLALPRGERGKRRASYLFDRLAGENRIATRWDGPGHRRVVTILSPGRAVGKSTGDAR